MASIAVDLDGVIHRYAKGWHDGSIYDEPIDGAFEALRELMKKYAVFILTTREAESVAAWLIASICSSNRSVRWINGMDAIPSD